MSLKYGFNFTASDMRKMLEENEKQQNGVRTWRQLFGNASLGYEAQKSTLNADYASAMAEAYKTSLAQKNALQGLGLSAGATQGLLSTAQADIHSAYQTYVQNYRNAMNTLSENYGTEVNNINADLNTRAQNFASLYESAYKYLTDELYGSYQTIPGTAANGAELVRDEDGDITGYTDITLDYFTDQGLNRLLSDNGEVLAWDILSHQLFDTNGRLTKEGRQFYDQMFNTAPENWLTSEGKQMRSFDKWLSDTNEELRNWWTSQDAYNYTFAGTNAGTAKTMLGLESLDDLYAPYQYTAPTDITADVYDAKKSTSDLPNLLTTFKNANDAYTEARREWQAASVALDPLSPNPDEKRERDAAYNKYMSAKSAFERARDKYTTTWETHLTDIETTVDTLQKTLKTNFGSDVYNEFEQSNKKLLTEYQQILADAKKSNNKIEYAEQLLAYYEKIVRAVKDFNSSHSYRPGTSGF